MATITGWIEDTPGGALTAIPASAYVPGTDIKLLIGRRVYERKRKHTDQAWIYVYQMTEPA
jgi:hypothetical protein